MCPTLKMGTNWWETDEYHVKSPVPGTMEHFAGPNGLALVRAWPNGTTSEGWGLNGKDGAPGFMERYNRSEFDARTTLYGYDKGKWAFAFVMRSMRVICIDIDGKNGGLEHAEELLGNAPATRAETSKSGNGYHLYYSYPAEWDETMGFAKYGDSIGIVQGVDIRDVGCVYHYDTQRWNNRDIAELPLYIAERLQRKADQREQTKKQLENISDMDPIEVLAMHSELEQELKKPMKAGSRNNTLFAIGSQMKAADHPEWEEKIHDRAIAVGLDAEEADKLVANISSYN